MRSSASDPLTPRGPADLATLSTQECRELDQRAIEEFGIPGLLLMEHASVGAARVAQQVLGRVEGRRVVIVCGPGNNGGDGYAMARHLHNSGARVRIRELTRADAIPPESDPGINRRLAARMGIPPETCVEAFPPLDPGQDGWETEILVDAIFGTGLTRPPEGRFAAAIRTLNAHPAPVLAVDIPSGLDGDTGAPLGEAVRAHWTVTFGVSKRGFQAPGAQAFLGKLYGVSIGIPRQILPRGAPGFPPEPIRWETVPRS